MEDLLDFAQNDGGAGFSQHDMSEFMTFKTEPSPPPINNNFQSAVTSPQPPPSFKKAKWTPDEDKLLIQSVKVHGMSNWSLVASDIPGRTGKQCRERWTNQLCPALNKDNWTPQEDAILIQQQRLHGNVWSKISKFLPGRSSNNIKNRWSWLSRHRIPPSLAAQMMPLMIQQQQRQMAQHTSHPQVPPMPQIFQAQQTAPPEMLWGSPTTQTPPLPNRIAFSDPMQMGGFDNSISSAHSLYSFQEEIEDNTMQFNFSDNFHDTSENGGFEAGSDFNFSFTEHNMDHDNNLWDTF